MELRKDLYIIPVDDGNIIYSPLRRSVFWANEQASCIVRRYIDGDGIIADKNSKVVKYITALEDAKISEPIGTISPLRNHLVIILSQICNLACTYCYAHEARSPEILDKRKLKIAYNSVLANENRMKYFSFIGGGEPLVTWDIIKWSVNYINTNKSKEDKVFYTITTNATLLSEPIIQFCRDNNIHIGISFEILKSIQDYQRPFNKSTLSTFDLIHHNIKQLMRNNVSFSIRSTITELNIALMPEMVRFIADNYPVLKKIHFEQVTDPKQNDAKFYSEFVHYFCEARKIGKERGIEVYNSISTSVFGIREQFCNGEMCVTPTGSLVACHRISSVKDKYYHLFRYGQIEEQAITIDTESYEKYRNFANLKESKCERCFAHWHCAGICPMERTVLSKEQLELKCDFTREIIKRILLEKVTGASK